VDVFIYFNERLPVGLDELEDALDAALGDIGEVTGTGVGESGSNLDLFLNDIDMTDDEIVGLIKRTLSAYKIPKSSEIVIGEKRFSLL
jgi:hypothetical protein